MTQRKTHQTPAPELGPVEFRSVDQIAGNKRNARTHSKQQIAQIAASISEFGFTNPILVDADDKIVAGHGRYEASKLLNLARVPTIRLDHLSPEQIRAYMIADNRLAQLAGWDEDILKLEFTDLENLDLDFDLEITGFDHADIDILIGPDSMAADDPADQVPPPTGLAVTQPRDVWQIGEHLLVCGDAKDNNAYAGLLGDQKAQMIFTDPPYNVPIAGHVSGLGKHTHREFAEASGEMSPEEFTDFLTQITRQLANWSEDGSMHFICMDWKHMGELLAAGSVSYTSFNNLCVWAKTNGGMGSLYRSRHELVFLFKNGNKPHINNVELGKHGRYRTNIWEYAGANAFGSSRDDDLSMHPTVKPTAMIADAIRDCSHRHHIILDPFGGSGSTMVAAERTNRKARLIELDPHYCDTIIKRMEKVYGLKAVLQSSGEEFAEVEAARLPESDANDEETAA